MTDNSMGLPFVRADAWRSRAPDARRRKIARIALSWAFVALVHLAFLVLISIPPRSVNPVRIVERETLLLLPPLAREAAPPRRAVRSSGPRPVPPLASAPITLPPMTLVPMLPSAGDIWRAIGQALACGASSFEYLPEDQRLACRYTPWMGVRAPDGSIVLAPPPAAPLGPLNLDAMSGAQAVRHEAETAPPCPKLVNTPCLDQIFTGRGNVGP